MRALTHATRFDFDIHISNAWRSAGFREILIAQRLKLIYSPSVPRKGAD